AITAPALVVGHPADPIHPAADAAMLAEEMPNATFLRAHSILEWRVRPDRLNRAAAGFALGCWQTQRRARRTSR
ncbi:MAG: alpha/beta fold hydrolase, partial [Nocardioides sp.]